VVEKCEMRRIGLGFIFVIVFLGLVSILSVKYTSHTKEHFLNQIDDYTATGDIIFRAGTGFWSPYFASLDVVNGYSHAGMLFKSARGLWFVVHAEANDDGTDGLVKKTPLHEFIADSKKFEVKKNNMSTAQKNIFVSSILTHLSQKTPFDIFFDIHDAGSKVYCTELIWIAARIAGINDFGFAVKLSGREFITVDSIYHSSYLEDVGRYKLLYGS